MKIIISPTMKMKEEQAGFHYKEKPFFLEKTERLLGYLKSLSDDELKRIWQTSEKLAQLNIKRIRRMDLEKNLSPAILSFQGLQYQYMGAQVLTSEELAYLEEHLYILSGFYGLLKPLDGIRPYRLEMKSRFEDWDYDSLYDYWQDDLAKKIQAESKVILNLASKEYSQTLTKHLTEETQVIDCVFGEWIEGKVNQKATLLKMARGEMVQYLARNQVSDLEEVKEFKGQGYEFKEELSDTDTFVFVKENEKI
ncbi:MAG: peroxide stress protein YaaA [Atopostipes sp.]|nr:peroxide stress protein YaaA [Atopostipes sp.]